MLIITSLPFTKDILLAKALTLSTASMHDDFECLGIQVYAYTKIGSDDP